MRSGLNTCSTCRFSAPISANMARRRPLACDPIEVRGNTAFERGPARTNHNSKAACADRRIERYSIVLIRNATLRRVGDPSENLQCRNRGAELTNVNDCPPGGTWDFDRHLEGFSHAPMMAPIWPDGKPLGVVVARSRRHSERHSPNKPPARRRARVCLVAMGPQLRPRIYR